MKLLPYQRDGVRALNEFSGRALLADEMGLGKTIQALSWLKQSGAFPAIAVCPLSVKHFWEQQARDMGFWVQTINAGDGWRYQKCDITVINYDILHKWVSALKSINPQTVIIDECQAICNPSTIRSKAVRSLCKGVPRVIGLSGTPMMNRPIELFPILHLIRPSEFPSQFDYAMRYCQPKMVRGKWEYKGATNLDELNERLKTCMIRRLKKDVLKDLPPKMRRIIPVELKDYGEYFDAQENFAKWLRENMPARANRALYNQAFTQIGYLLRICGRLKVRAINRWIDEFLEATDQKLIVFGHHRAMVQGLHKRYDGRSVLIDGQVKGIDRKAAVQNFQLNPQVRVFLGNLAASSGITLTAASEVLFTEFFWRPGDHLQAEDRPHRIGQTNPVWINYLVAVNTIEERICAVIQRKQDWCRSTLDGDRLNGERLGIFDELLEALKEEVR